jgi:peptide chain release factor 1
VRVEDFRAVLERLDEIDRRIAAGTLTPQSPDYGRAMRERARLVRVREGLERYRGLGERLEQARALLSDAELGGLAREEIAALERERDRLRAELEDFLLEDEGPVPTAVLIEIRPGTGGEEAALFAGELLRMYLRYAQRRGWKAQLLDENDTDLGGVKFAAARIEGEEAARLLRFESGTHRVQRVPKTEASGRIHTSAATVAVLPEFEDVEIEIRREDLRIDTFAAGGPGGQHQNKTASAVRITHIPTGVAVACRSERSQHRNRELALRWLKARLLERMEGEQARQLASMRRAQIGSGDRSEKIRTYNFPQSRVTDHRIGFTTHRLAEVLDGDLDEIILALVEADRARRVQARKGVP